MFKCDIAALEKALIDLRTNNPHILGFWFIWDLANNRRT